MAHSGMAFFDSKGQLFRSAEDATLSDLSGLLGRVGEGESLAPGIAKILLEKRAEIERIFNDHDGMIAACEKQNESVIEWPFGADGSPKVTSIR